MWVVGTAFNRNIVIQNIAEHLIVANADNSHFNVEYDPIPSHVSGEIMADQMLYVVDSSLVHDRLEIEKSTAGTHLSLTG
jgi:hypothetical protein